MAYAQGRLGDDAEQAVLNRGPNPQSAIRNPQYGELVRQYLELRDAHPGVILLFRVGSFYEVLFADAELAAGSFKAGQSAPEDAAAELQRRDPAEIVVPSDRPAPDHLLARRTVTPVGPSTGAAGRLRRAFPEGPLAGLPLAQVAAGLI